MTKNQPVYITPTAPKIPAMDDTNYGLFAACWKQWAAKLPRNHERLVYWDMRNALKDFNVSIPPALAPRLNVVSGWAAKAVNEPANRTVFNGMIGADGHDDPFDLEPLLEANQFRVELPQAIRSAMAYSTSFITTTPGHTAAGEPDVLIQFHSAMWATGLWSNRARGLSAGLIVNATDNLGTPTAATFMTPALIFTLEARGKHWEIVDLAPTHLPRVPMNQLPTTPDLDRPFGRSRIDRVVMSIVDRAVRGDSRLDVHSELFSAMKLILMGASEEAFRDESGNTIPLWSWYSGRLNLMGRDEEGELPKLETIRAESPEPHIALMRHLAAEFSGHTGVPLGSLGITQDNPESADAKTVAREDMIFMIEQQHNIYSHALRRALGDAIALRDKTGTPPEEMTQVHFDWRRPDRASQAAIADAGMKQVTAAGLEGTRIGMRMIGMSPHQIAQADEEKRRHSARRLLDLMETTPQEQQPAQEAETVA